MNYYILQKYNQRIGFWEPIETGCGFDPGCNDGIKRARFEMMDYIDSSNIDTSMLRVVLNGGTVWTSEGWTRILQAT